MKFGQLLEYKTRNIFFFKKSSTKYGGQTLPKPFSKKINICG